MKIDPEEFRVREGKKPDLSRHATRTKPLYASKSAYEAQLQKEVLRLADLQDCLYADNRYALLVIFQAMDAAGKDGAIKHVFSGINPQGVRVTSFKHPSEQELEHDFMWRIYPCLPEHGHIGVFNRSYYEEVLVVRVHPEILAMQNLPHGLKPGNSLWKQRYSSMRSLERHLRASGTHVVKFFLNVSKEEQRKRLLARLDEPEKNWKFQEGDLKERTFWKDYMRAYEDCLGATSTRDAPWYVVPADDKQNARLIVAKILAQTLSGMKPAYPEVGETRRGELLAMREQLQK